MVRANNKTQQRFGFSIRTKLALVSILLLTIPWTAYVYVRDMKSFLLAGQENALTLTVRAIATVLHDRPELFLSDEEEVLTAEPGDIYAHPLPSFINLDGELEDWGEEILSSTTFAMNLEGELAENLLVRHTVGYRGAYVFAFFDVEDDFYVSRNIEMVRLDTSDQLRITLQSPAVGENRYLFTAEEPGRMSVYLMDQAWEYPLSGDPNYDMAANIQNSNNGYRIELRVPRYLLSSDARIQMEIVDVDDSLGRTVQDIVPFNPEFESASLSRVVVSSPEITRILRSLDRPDSRIWVLDSEGNIRTVLGELSQPDENINRSSTFGYLGRLEGVYNLLISYIFELIGETNLDSANITFTGEPDAVLNQEIIKQALNGTPSSSRISGSTDSERVIVMAAHPIWLADNVIGAVVVEQSDDEVLYQQQAVLEKVIGATLLILIGVIAAIFIFASRLTLRITRLRNATDGAIDRDGRIIQTAVAAEAKAGDEIGDLSRSVNDMLGRLSQYTNYLEGLPDTLAHEVSNPLNVVNSSLDNLSKEHPLSADSKYMSRAQSGLQRIRSILKNLTEAANLEQAMQLDEREVFDFPKMLEDYVDGCRHTHPDREFRFSVFKQPSYIDGHPDHIVQMLDKLIDNALDFAVPGTPIRLIVRELHGHVILDIANQGKILPEGMAERIFEPLVSLGRSDAKKTRLGMGLYIVTLIARFHQGNVSARNNVLGDGVTFRISFPLTSIESAK
ncbi:MAG: ATP-binding protein [Arenicellaceae bacterium]|nr:ATP-binding protein [Arenicellaceae bacterium]